MTPVFQLVGYSHLRELGRVRVYVRAADPLGSARDVFIQLCPGRFSFDGDPLQVRRAPEALAMLVNAHFHGGDVAEDAESGHFEAALPPDGLRPAG